MLYVARTLHTPSGEELSSMVIAVSEGRVSSITPFRNEVHSMVFVNEAYLATSGCIHSVSQIEKEIPSKGESLFAYMADSGGRLRLLP